MDRFGGLRLNVCLALVGAAIVWSVFDSACVAGGYGHGVAGSCTNDMTGGHPQATGVVHGRRRVSHGACHGRGACHPGPQACGPSRCGHAACCPGACGRGICCPGHGCHGAGCHGACCHDLCEQIGHSLHHDVYEKRYFLRSQGKSWHSTWYDPAEGRPIALVVPPTAEFQTQYGWGVPSSRVAPIYHQFRRPYPGPGGVGGAGGGFLPTPNQPSDTVQFGVNAVRGPWGAY